MSLLYREIAEADRVLRDGGFLCTVGVCGIRFGAFMGNEKPGHAKGILSRIQAKEATMDIRP